MKESVRGHAFVDQAQDQLLAQVQDQEKGIWVEVLFVVCEKGLQLLLTACFEGCMVL